MHPLIQGIALGLTLAALLGPALFTLLQTSISWGRRAGSLLALGIFLSDSTIVALAYLGVLQLLDQNNNYTIAGIIGGCILIVYGVFTFYHKINIEDVENKAKVVKACPVKRPPGYTFMLKGYFLNIMNPMVWFLWISTLVGVSSGYEGHKYSILIFFAATLLTVLSTDILKVIIAYYIKQHLNHKILMRLNHIVGILLVSFGIVLIVKMIFKI